MSRFENISDVWSFLEGIPMFQKVGTLAANFSLDNISEFCSKLGNPHLNYPTIHVAGTNGKGTTCYLLEKVYRDAGYKTGMFISPHLLRYNERVQVEGTEISDEDLLIFFQTAGKLFDEVKLSYFEISTALAFWFFAKQKVDIAIIEAGLGGRLDSTNIVESEISVITSIGLDHQSVLGNSVKEIAFEKAGIIKPKKPVVVGNVDAEAAEVIAEQANQRNSKILYAGDLKPEWKRGVISFGVANIEVHSLLKESVNKWNVACAWQVFKTLSATFPVSEEGVIQSISTFTGPPGRFEKLHADYNWYFSGSHNNQALDASLEAVREIKELENTVLVFSAMKDKVTPEFIERLQPFKKRYFVQQEGERAAKLSDIENEIEVELMSEQSAQRILKELKTELVIFAGSFYF
ncbi:MAG: folylpolyglutamate synthase/dihydrofolate synthase family protein, partial [Balneolaceae bacterium]